MHYALFTAKKSKHVAEKKEGKKRKRGSADTKCICV